MILKKSLKNGDLQAVEASEETLGEIIKLVERDLRDSQIKELSADRRYATAYGAGLNLANYLIRKEGYRVSAKVGHHRTTFLVAAEILGEGSDYFDYFDVARRKRNKVDYDISDVASESEVQELLNVVFRFRALIFKI